MNTLVSEPDPSSVQPYDVLGSQLRVPPGGTKGQSASTDAERLAVSDHFTWLGTILSDRWQPTPDFMKAVQIFGQEAGNFDVVRGTLSTNGGDLDTASSHYVLSVSAAVDDIGAKGSSPQEVAESAAALLFNLPTNAFVFHTMGTEDGMTYGVRDFKSGAKPFDADWPHWGDVLAWWSDGKTVEFVTTKAPGGPTQEVILPSALQNQYWFTKPKGKPSYDPSAGG